MVCGEEETPDDSAAMLVFVLEVVDGDACDSDSGNILLRSVVNEKEEVASVGSSVMDEEIFEGLNGDGVGVEGVAVGDGGYPDGWGLLVIQNVWVI